MNEIGLLASQKSRSTFLSALTTYDLAFSDDEGNVTSDVNDSADEKPDALQQFQEIKQKTNRATPKVISERDDSLEVTFNPLNQFKVTIDLQNCKEDSAEQLFEIIVTRNDSAEELASRFCKDHDL
jgi:hypothetical protein